MFLPGRRAKNNAAGKVLTAVCCVFLLACVLHAVERSFEALEKFKNDAEQLYELADYSAAEKTWEIGLELAKSASDRQWTIYFLLKLGEVEGEMGKLGSAFNYLEQSMKYCKSEKDEKGLGVTYLKMGRVYAKFGKYKEAASSNQKAIEIFTGLGMKEGPISVI